jgi:transcriptional regulator with XRE-family HTH domain
MYTFFTPVHPVYMSKRPGQRGNRATYRRTYIRQWREVRERTLEDIADKIGITHASLSRIERGLQPYSQAILEAIAAELSTDVASLLTRDPTDPETIWPIWDQAKPAERKMILDIAKTIVKSNR